MDRKEKLLPLPSDFFKKVPAKKAVVKPEVKGEDGKLPETPTEVKGEPKKPAATTTTNRGKPSLLQNFLGKKKDLPSKAPPVVAKTTESDLEARKVSKIADSQAERERVFAEEKATAKKRKELEDKMWNSDAKKQKAEGDVGGEFDLPAPDEIQEPAAKKQKKEKKTKKEKKGKMAKKEKHNNKERKKSDTTKLDKVPAL